MKLNAPSNDGLVAEIHFLVGEATSGGGVYQESLRAEPWR
jgi:hypothetical protein